MTIASRGDWLGKQRRCSLCWKLPDRAQSFVFCSQIVVSKYKMIGMLLNVVHGQVQKKLTKTYEQRV